MENLFDDDDLPLDDSCDAIKEEQFTNVLPTLQLDTSLNKNIKTDDEDESIDICSTEALLEIVNENPTTLVPRVFPGPMEERLTETSMLEFFSTPGTHFMHIQMPNAMPGLDKDRTLKWKPTANRDIYKPKQTDQPPPIQTTQEPLSYNTSHLASLPSGKLGRIRIHKSGKVRLHIGNHVFNFAQGNRMTCKQQVGCLLEENNEFLFLGNYHKKFVVSPDISTMWKQQE